MLGDVLVNRYRVLRLLGEGAMGQVWLVHDSTTERDVALKVITSRAPAPGGSEPARHSQEKSYLDFIQEFRLMTQLRHPNCCEVLEYGLLNTDTPYLTMEYVPGRGLDEVAPVDRDTFVRLMGQVAMALGYVHARGLVHCDVKAANVRLRPDGVVKLMDYGLMEYAGRTGGAIKGTLHYLAPETFRRGLIDRRTDLYALGVLGFYLLSGRFPCDGPTPGDIIRAHMGEPPPSLSSSSAGVDPVHEALVLRLLAKDPLDRPDSAEAVLRALGYAETTVGGGGGLLTSPMVGRVSEMAKLFVQLARVTAGKPGGSICFVGPAGTGKSRLVREFSFNVRLENLAYAEAHNHEFAQTPYAPIGAMLKGLLPHVREEVPEVLAQLAPILVELLPELSVTPAPELDALDAKYRLHGAVVALLQALAERRGTVLVLEDQQWVDPLTQELLVAIQRLTPSLPLLLLGTSRRNEPWLAAAGATLIPLGALDAPALQRMVESMLGTTELPDRLMSHLVSASVGVPDHIQALLTHHVRLGALTRHDGAWQFLPPPMVDAQPYALQSVYARKFSDLPDVSQALARIATVIGEEFSLDLLREVADFPENVFFEALEPLLAQQLLAPGESGGYRLAQDAWRAAIAASIHLLDRQHLHARIASIYLRRAGDPSYFDLPLAPLNQVTAHLLESNQPLRAIQATLELGTRLAALSALDEALHHLTAGLQLVEVHSPGDPREAVFLRLLGEVYLQQGQLDRASDSFEHAIPLVEALGDRFLLARLLVGLSQVLHGKGQLDHAVQLAERAHRVALDASDLAGAARARLLAARAAGLTGRTRESLEWLQEALGLARLTEERALEGEVLAELGYLHLTCLAEGLEVGLQTVEEALHLAESLGDARGIIQSLTLLAQAGLAQGEVLGARQHLLRARKVAAPIGNALELCSLETLLALIDLERGDFKLAALTAQRNVAEAGRLGARHLLGIGLMTEALANVWLGHFQEASALMDVAFDQAGGGLHLWREVRMLALKGEVLAAMGRYSESMRTAERLQQLMVETGSLEPQGRLCALWGENLVRAGDPAEAREYLDMALSLAESGKARGVQLRVQLLRARLALQSEDWGLARQCAEESLLMARALGVRHAEALALGLRAEARLATNEAGAFEDFDGMRAFAAADGLPLLLSLAEFGLAAAQPYAPDAANRASEARSLLSQTISGLTAEAREKMLAPTELQRVLEGNYIGFSLPRQVQKSLSSPSVNLHLWMR
ncbi:MAG: AAA family ATPase [Candidatus Sericytochromatia bacterium]|nr:AAA family ATPase [Candidatus Sericytochromatia bacterium]